MTSDSLSFVKFSGLCFTHLCNKAIFCNRKSSCEWLVPTNTPAHLQTHKHTYTRTHRNTHIHKLLTHESYYIIWLLCFLLMIKYLSAIENELNSGKIICFLCNFLKDERQTMIWLQQLTFTSEVTIVLYVTWLPSASSKCLSSQENLLTNINYYAMTIAIFQ